MVYPHCLGVLMHSAVCRLWTELESDVSRIRVIYDMDLTVGVLPLVSVAALPLCFHSLEVGLRVTVGGLKRGWTRC